MSIFILDILLRWLIKQNKINILHNNSNITDLGLSIRQYIEVFFCKKKKKRQIYTTFKALILGINTTTHGRNGPRESKYRQNEREREQNINKSSQLIDIERWLELELITAHEFIFYIEVLFDIIFVKQNFSLTFIRTISLN